MNALALALLLSGAAPAPPAAAEVTLVAFSDYHSHAVPFYSEGAPGQAGLARAVAYLRRARNEANAVIVSGGDMMNLGTPAWSDEYRCRDWAFFDGLVDAMALGNHEYDYGALAFDACRASVSFPVLAANLHGADGRPLLTHGGKPYLVKEVAGRRLGLIAVAGPDFVRLVKTEWLPPGARFADPVATARELVGRLRRDEKVDAVILIGHQHREDDFALARAVSGIDLVLGTHSHHKGELQVIPGTRTWYVSPFQYLTYVSRLTLRFEGRRLAAVGGGLVKMDAALPEDPAVAAEVARWQAQLEQSRPERFAVVGRAAVALTDDGAQSGESVIGNWATEVLRRATGAHVFFNTASSFRGTIPPGEVTAESFARAIPYKNRLVRATFTGAQVLNLLQASIDRRGSDGFSQQTGLRYRLHEGRPVQVEVLADPARREAGFVPLDPTATYAVGTTDFQAKVANGYRDLFAAGSGLVVTDQDAQALLLEDLKQGAAAALDGRDGGR
ncbi:MAG: bifunctional metallophosphatase/5'-nucleotidase [Vicinamibacteria bacterium]|nr:bifunctional metallophosphatase/5'-nucleotidase [Vicinamibacteria bacterium]